MITILWKFPADYSIVHEAYRTTFAELFATTTNVSTAYPSCDRIDRRNPVDAHSDIQQYYHEDAE